VCHSILDTRDDTMDRSVVGPVGETWQSDLVDRKYRTSVPETEREKEKEREREMSWPERGPSCLISV